LLVSFVDSIKVAYNDDAHKPIVSELISCREYSNWLGFTIDVM